MRIVMLVAIAGMAQLSAACGDGLDSHPGTGDAQVDGSSGSASDASVADGSPDGSAQDVDAAVKECGGMDCPFACVHGDTCVTGTSVAAGFTWTCASLSDGTARCWGRNHLGQLGVGDTVDSQLPREVVDLADVRRVVAGEAAGHTCALREGRRASCWGPNERGQLGDGTFVSRTAPVSVSLANIDAVTVGLAHTCVRVGGLLYCWGFNDAGQLGLGDTDDRSIPTPVPPSLTGVVADVHAGLSHTCVARADGRVLCWGYNDRGQVGVPSPREGGETALLEPTLVAGVENAIQVSLGQAHSCALVGPDGPVRCWGWNEYGQLGNGGLEDRAEPVEVVDEDELPLFGIERVIAGPSATCALTIARGAYCWGRNSFGALGTGSAASFAARAQPVTAVGAEEILDIAIGDAHTCFLTATRIRCVGFNAYGQLGDGTAADSSSGVDVVL